jgi:hypothetical protein
MMRHSQHSIAQRFLYVFNNVTEDFTLLRPFYQDLVRILEIAYGESHDQADAEWIVIRTQLWGPNDTPFGWPAPSQPSGRPGSGCPSGVFCMF